jgi:hypothetical protein
VQTEMGWINKSWKGWTFHSVSRCVLTLLSAKIYEMIAQFIGGVVSECENQSNDFEFDDFMRIDNQGAKHLWCGQSQLRYMDCRS